VDQHGDICGAIETIGKMSPQKKKELVDSFASEVRGVPLGEMGVCLVIGDSGRPKYSHTLISDKDRERLRNYTWIVGGEYAHRFPQLYWTFMDVLFGDVGVGLRLDACDITTWQLMLNAGLKETFGYIVDDFNVMSSDNKVKKEAALPLMQGIWNVMRPGGIFVSSWNATCISVETAKGICNLFDVYITDDVYSCVQYGYVPTPWRGDKINPMYYCLRFFVNHPEDERLKRLSPEARANLESTKKKIDAAKAGGGQIDLSDFCKNTHMYVSYSETVIKELQEKWSTRDLSNMQYRQELTPNLLSKYTISNRGHSIQSNKLAWVNVPLPIAMYAPNGTGIFVVFRKKG
jgi:hypothetical protein